MENTVEAGRKRGLRKAEGLQSRLIEADRGTKYGDELRKMQWLVLRILGMSQGLPTLQGLTGESPEEIDLKPSGVPFGTFSEFIRESSACSAEPEIGNAILSAALDRAIDEADLVTDTKVMPFSDGTPRIVRVFRPDGEIVSSDVRRAASLWRSSSPPPPFGRLEIRWT